MNTHVCMTLLCIYVYLRDIVFTGREYSLFLQRSVVSGVGECLLFLQVHRLTPICARSLINRGIWWFWRGMPAAPWGAANSALGQALAPHI